VSEQLIRQVADRQAIIEQELKSISEVLQELAAQKKDIEHLLVGQQEQRGWLKDHETRMQSVEKKQEACPINSLTEEVKILRTKPGDTALKFLYAVSLLAIGSFITLAFRG